MYNHGIYIFRRDLIIEDNVGFIRANKECELITPIFIFTHEQISPENKFRSDNAIQFMIVYDTIIILCFINKK